MQDKAQSQEIICWFHPQLGSNPAEVNGSARVLDVLPVL